VTVSAPGVGVLAQEEHRLRRQLPAEGFTDHDVDVALELMHEQLRRVAAGEDPARIHADQRPWRDAAWYPLLVGTSPATIAFLARIADFDPAPALAALTCPVLAIFGADDVLIPVAESARIIGAALDASGHTNHQIVVFPAADHNIGVFTGDGPPVVRNGRYTPSERAAGFDELICQLALAALHRRPAIAPALRTGWEPEPR
jgi:pimeloyl-ACP methyl ester carboxylesterase